MSNRFLDIGRIGGTGVRRAARHGAAWAVAARPHALSRQASDRWARPFSAADRVLVVLLENGGVDLGIPALVDRLLSSLPGSSAIPDSFKESLVNTIREKLRSVTDSLLESAELLLNRYTDAKPGLFGDVIVLRDGTASYDDLKRTLLAQSRAGKIIDVIILTHGGDDSISVVGGITGQRIRDMRTELGAPLRIRAVYMMNCVGASLNQAWLDAGARASAGTIRNNYLPEPTTFFFWTNWREGRPFEEAVTSAYRKTVNLMNDTVRGLLSSIPLAGDSLASSVDFSSMDFVRDSAPVVQGVRSVTIESEDLSIAKSVSNGMATALLPVALLRSLSATPAGDLAPATPRCLPISAAGLDFMKQWEGLRPKLCIDPEGHCTIGYGTVLHSGRCDGRAVEEPYAAGITAEAAAQLLAQKCAEVQQFINDRISTSLNQNQSDALICFVYNIGAEAFETSTLLKALNAGDTAAAGSEIRKWTKASANGVVSEVPALANRRNAESALFEQPAGLMKSLSWQAGRRRPPVRASSKYLSPSRTVRSASVYAVQQNPALLIAGIEVADAAQIGLAAISVAQAQASASQGTFTLTYAQAQRLLTPEARRTMPGAQQPKQRYVRRVLYLGIGAIAAAEADVIIEWEGNPYGEIGTPVIRRDLKESTEWTRSAANIQILKLDRIPLPGTDPRTWPIVYSYEGTYDPWGNGYFEFTGEFEINAFGGIKFNRHEVVSRSAVDVAIAGIPEDKVQRGPDVLATVPPIPPEQAAHIRPLLP